MSLLKGHLAKNAAAGGGGFYDTEISQSLRLNDDDSAYLSRTPASAGNRKTWTWSGWVKLGNIGTAAIFFGGKGASIAGEETVIGMDSSNRLFFYWYHNNNPNVRANVRTSALYRDPSAWYHITIAVDTTQATSSNRVKMYVNGEEITSFSSATYPPQNDTTFVNNTSTHYIGRNGANTAKYDGYLAEVNFIDGTALDATSFGEFKSGVWIPKEYTGSYGTNGFYLDFGNSGSIGADVSGNGNNWTANNLAATDVVLDSPTNNFATLNPISRNGSNGDAVFSDGNLVVTRASGDNYQAMATIPVTSGKWYVELTGISGTNLRGQFGFLVNDKSSNTVSNRAISQDGYSYRAVNGQAYAFNVGSSYGATWTDGDVIGLALDADNGSATFYKNGASQGVAFSGITADNYLIGTNVEDGCKVSLNFGQDSSFAGNKTAQGNTDANGYGDFYYAPPSGYLALCTANLPDPVASIDPAQDGSPQDHFNTVLWTGNGSHVDVGFDLDLLWYKARNTTSYAGIVDSIRGDDVYLQSYSTNGDVTYTGLLVTDSTGFTPGSVFSSNSYVGWNWKAGGSGVSNTDGSVTTTVSANPDAGFAIVDYNGGGNGSTMGHGLGAVPACIVVKKRDTDSPGNARGWAVYHKALASDKVLELNTTNAQLNEANFFREDLMSTSVFGVNGDYNTGYSGDDYIAYVWAEVDGFSKFGSYIGNGSDNGTFVYTGFRPAFVMTKMTSSAGNWRIHDEARSVYNPMNEILYPNLSNSEDVDNDIDFTSNGFKLRNNLAQENASGATMVYMAFAENPFKYANAR